MVDTNSDPRQVDYVIPSNDDASKSIDKILSHVTDAIAVGLTERKAEKSDKSEGADVPKSKVEKTAKPEGTDAPKAKVKIKKTTKVVTQEEEE